ncbi:MAG: class I SAM-dependent methyltransferase [Solirubrobacteraceae bacterium]
MTLISAVRGGIQQRFRLTAHQEQGTKLQTLRQSFRQVRHPIRLQELEALSHADQGVLRDPERLPALIREMGLSDYHPHKLPASTHLWLGRGLRTLQPPNQFAAYLAFLADREVATYAEIGIADGGSFTTTVTYLEATGHALDHALAIEPTYSPGVARFARRHPAVQYLRAKSSDPVVRAALLERPWDLIFIDGDHSYNGCRSDVELARSAGARMIVLHDIVEVTCPGVGRVWQELRAEHATEYDFHEFTDQYPEVTEWTRCAHYGIGVAVRRAPT